MGFTLIELMIVVLIASILAAVAYPSYTRSVASSRRSDAFGTLLGFSNAMERLFTQQNTYVGAANGGAPNAPIAAVFPNQAPLNGNTPYYNLVVQAEAATTFTLRAIPINAQAGDGILDLDSTGARRWDRNNDGDFLDARETDWDR